MDAASIFLEIRAISGSNYPSRSGVTMKHHHESNFRPGGARKQTTNLPTKASLRISRIKAVDDISGVASDPAQAEITWQIILGTLAGVTPFVVAGIEFSKRIVAQRQCKVCKGSGLVLRDNKYYFRCPRCGGFLPWQSWRRFFTG